MIRSKQENRNFLINDQKPTQKVIAENLRRLKQTSKSGGGGAFINLCFPAFSPRDPLQKISINIIVKQVQCNLICGVFLV